VASPLKGATAVETHSAILDLVRSSGVVSRIELADRSGLTGASISRIVKQLMAEGLITEVGLGDRTGGKRRTLFQLNPRSRHAVGISPDFANITYVITNLRGEVVTQMQSAGTGQESPRRVVQRIANELRPLLSSAGVDNSTLEGIGIAVAGRQDTAHHVLRSNPSATEWELFDIEDTLNAATDLPVVVENDSTCAAIGEFWVGRIPASADFATVYLATGFGLGLVTNGDVYRGSSSNVGEIGHMVLDVDGPDCWCGSRGCLEVLAAPRSIVKRALSDRKLTQELGLSRRKGDVRENAALITAGAAARHPRCLELIEESAFYLARALVSITNLLDLDQIILAGPGFAGVGEIYVRKAAEDLEQLSFLKPVHPTKVGLSKWGPNSAALGAASLVLHSRLTPHQTSSRLALSTR
jgi:predicted NBD/HSP70 family sugar kinase